MGGGGGVGGAIKTAVSVVASPITAPLALAKSVAPDAVANVQEKIAGVPVVGTLSQGAEAASNIHFDTASGVVTGDFSAARKDAVDVAKAGVVVGGAYAAGGAAGALIGDGVARRGIDVGSLTNMATNYLGGELNSALGFDVTSFLPKNGGTKAPDFRTTGSMGGGGSFLDPGTEPAPAISNTTIVLGVLAVIIFVAVIKRR